MTILIFMTFVSLILGWVAILPVIREVWTHQTELPYATYLGWSLVGVTQIFLHWQVTAEGGLASLVFVAGTAAIPLTILLLIAISGTKWQWEKRDKMVYGAILICWLLWLSLNGSEGVRLEILPLIVLMMTDGISSWPILREAWQGKLGSLGFRVSWSLTALSTILGLLSVERKDTLEVFIPAYLCLYMSAIAVLSLTRRSQAI